MLLFSRKLVNITIVYLAFEPVGISEDKKSLTMRFWWLPRREYSPQVSMVIPPSLPPGLKASSSNAKLWNCDTDEPIYSGQIMTIRTSDPETMPLPSFQLLQMQWFLNRVAAISGAADVTDEELEDYFGHSYGFGDPFSDSEEETSDDDSTLFDD